MNGMLDLEEAINVYHLLVTFDSQLKVHPKFLTNELGTRIEVWNLQEVFLFSFILVTSTFLESTLEILGHCLLLIINTHVVTIKSNGVLASN